MVQIESVILMVTMITSMVALLDLHYHMINNNNNNCFESNSFSLSNILFNCERICINCFCYNFNLKKYMNVRYINFLVFFLLRFNKYFSLGVCMRECVCVFFLFDSIL